MCFSCRVYVLFYFIMLISAAYVNIFLIYTHYTMFSYMTWEYLFLESLAFRNRLKICRSVHIIVPWKLNWNIDYLEWWRSNSLWRQFLFDGCMQKVNPEKYTANLAGWHSFSFPGFPEYFTQVSMSMTYSKWWSFVIMHMWQRLLWSIIWKHEVHSHNSW